MRVYELSAASLIAFATTTFLMNITPGPAVMQVVGHSMSNGWRASQASILGVFAANALYCALAVLRLGAVILAAPSLFEVIKWCGVSYLAWLGVKALRSAYRAGAPWEAPTLEARPLALFRQSFVLQGENPKSVLYFCTLLPVFAGEAEGAPLRIERLVQRHAAAAGARRPVGRRAARRGRNGRERDAAQSLRTRGRGTPR